MVDDVFNVVCTSMLPGEALDSFSARADMNLTILDHPCRERLEEALRDADALICLLRDRIDDAMMASAPRLKVIANYAVGYDNIDVEAATRRGIWVCNTPDVLTNATADLAFALLLAVSRRIVEADAFVRSGRFHGWEPDLLLGRDLYGGTLGIVGCGRIGRAVASRAGGFGMRVLYFNRSQLPPEVEKELGVEYAPLCELVERSDFISIHVPGGRETERLFDEGLLGRCKRGCIIVNTARGSVIDEEALVRSLEDGHLAGAGLDVFEKEPRVHPRLLELPNVVLAPHIGSATKWTRSTMAELVVRNVEKALRGERPPAPVNDVP